MVNRTTVSRAAMLARMFERRSAAGLGRGRGWFSGAR